MTYTAKAAQYKKDSVSNFTKLMNEYPIVGLVNAKNLPSRQFQILRKKLRKDVLLLMGKKQFIKMAIDSVKDKKDFGKLAEAIEGMPALLFTKQNPFKVAALIKASKSKAPAKPGQVAPYDLIVPAGPTPFTPGPIISELGAVGLKTGVEHGKVTIKENATIVKAGEVVSKKASDILAKFSIEPMEMGLDLVAAYEDGLVYGRDVLSISPDAYLAMLKTAAAESLGLSIEIGYTTKDNIERFIGKAYATAKKFALDQKIISDVLLEKEVGEAGMAAKSIADAAKFDTSAFAPAAEVKEEPKPEAAPETVPEKKEEKKEEPKPEPKAEEKKPEAPVAEEEKEEAPAPEEKKKQDPLAPAKKVSEDFKEEISEEKKRRDSADQDAAADLVKKLKKKGTLRQ